MFAFFKLWKHFNILLCKFYVNKNDIFFIVCDSMLKSTYHEIFTRNFSQAWTSVDVLTSFKAANLLSCCGSESVKFARKYKFANYQLIPKQSIITPEARRASRLSSISTRSISIITFLWTCHSILAAIFIRKY